MRKHIPNYDFQFLQGGGRLFIASVFFFMIGISAGVFTELMMSAPEKGAAVSYFNQYFLIEHMTGKDYADLFVSSAANNLGVFLIIILSCLTAFGFPIAIAALVYKGAVLGFSASLLINCLPAKGMIYIFTSMIPQNFLFIPAIIAAAAVALKLAFHTLANRRFGLKKNLTEHSAAYALCNAIFAVIILFGCLIEAFVCPFLTQLVG